MRCFGHYHYQPILLILINNLIFLPISNAFECTFSVNSVQMRCNGFLVRAWLANSQGWQCTKMHNLLACKSCVLRRHIQTIAQQKHKISMATEWRLQPCRPAATLGSHGVSFIILLYTRAIKRKHITLLCVEFIETAVFVFPMTTVCLPRRSASDEKSRERPRRVQLSFDYFMYAYCVQFSFLGLCACVRLHFIRCLGDKQLPLPQRVQGATLRPKSGNRAIAWTAFGCIGWHTVVCIFPSHHLAPPRMVCVPMEYFVCATVSIQLKTFNIHQLINEPINATRSKHFVPSRQTHSQLICAAHLLRSAHMDDAPIYAPSRSIAIAFSTLKHRLRTRNMQFFIEILLFHIFNAVDARPPTPCRCREIVSPVVYGIEAEIARIMFDFLWNYSVGNDGWLGVSVWVCGRVNMSRFAIPSHPVSRYTARSQWPLHFYLHFVFCGRCAVGFSLNLPFACFKSNSISTECDVCASVFCRPFESHQLQVYWLNAHTHTRIRLLLLLDFIGFVGTSYSYMNAIRSPIPRRRRRMNNNFNLCQIHLEHSHFCSCSAAQPIFMTAFRVCTVCGGLFVQRCANEIENCANNNNNTKCQL